MIGFHMQGHRHRGAGAAHHDPAPPAILHRSPFPWFAVAIVAAVTAAALG